MDDGDAAPLPFCFARDVHRDPQLPSFATPHSPVNSTLQSAFPTSSCFCRRGLSSPACTPATPKTLAYLPRRTGARGSQWCNQRARYPPGTPSP